MSKYSSEFKLKVVNYYLKENHGYKETAKHFKIPACSNVKKWVRKYQEHGVSGLIRNQQKYDGNFRINVVKYMHENHLSLQETAIHFNLAGDYVISKWEHIYYEEGPQALFEERRGRSKNMNSNPEKISEEIEKDLIEENERLRMENAYLKKLQALVQERTKPKNGKK